MTVQRAAHQTAPQSSARAAAALRAIGALSCSMLLLASFAPRAGAADSAPQVQTKPATGVSYSAATLNATIYPGGESTEYFFQYGTSRKFGSETPLAPAGHGTARVDVGQAISGLAAYTTYHYRVLATNALGATAGAEKTFTTSKIPLSVAIVGVPNPVTYGSAFTVEGTLSGTDAAGQQIILQANPFAYTAGFQQLGNPELANTAGGFSFPVLGAQQNTQLRVLVASSPTVASPTLLEQVAVEVSLQVHTTNRHGYARLYGTVQPAEVGALVGFQLLKPGHRSKNVGGTVVKAGTATSSRFSRVLRVGRGLYEALVQVSDGAHVSNTSLPVLIR